MTEQPGTDSRRAAKRSLHFHSAAVVALLLAAAVGCAPAPRAAPDPAPEPAPAAVRLMTPADLVRLPSNPADHRISYGEDPNQFGELRVPQSPGPHPVAILVHGGCWKDFGTVRHIGPVGDALKAEGIASWSIGYRRLPQPGSGWPGTFLDVGRAVDHLRQIAPQHNLDLDRVVVVGHSSGGHLATWMAARPRLPRESELYMENPLPVRGVVTLAGPADLEEGIETANRYCGEPVVQQLMGGTPAELPERYAHGSPANLLPLGVPQVLIIGEQDDIGLLPLRRYAEAARRSGDPVRLSIVPEARHFEPGNPLAPTWPVIRQAIESLLAGKPVQ